MTIQERIKAFIKNQGISTRQFELKCGLSNGAVSKMGNSTKRSVIDKILHAYPEIDEIWLLTGKSTSDDESTAKLLGRVYAASEGDDDVAMVDYIPATATASFIEYVGEGNPDFEKIAVLKQQGETLDKNYKVFEVIGESMSPAIPNRAKILTREIAQPKWVHAEGVVVVVFGDEVVVKRIINNDLATSDSLVLTSDNPKFGERRIALADIRAMYKALRIVSADIL